MPTHFKDIQIIQEDSVTEGVSQFKSDSRSEKYNLIIGAYRDSEGKPYVLETVKNAEKIIQSQHLDKEYLPIEGTPSFIKGSLELIFGDTFDPEHMIGFQAVGGTGALMMGGHFLQKHLSSNFYISNYSWPNHLYIFENADMKVDKYPYYDIHKHVLLFDEMCQFFENLPEKSIVLLHTVCQNPTGFDLNIEQWKKLSEIFKKKNLFPFFDYSYGGFSQDPFKDAEPIRLFLKEGHEMVVACTYSKNFGLYNDRIGFFGFVSNDTPSLANVKSQIKQLIRATYSNPPSLGSRIVDTILNDATLKHNWLEELKNMRDRVNEMRYSFSFGLQVHSKHTDFSYIRKGKGLFNLLDLTHHQIHALRKQFGIYLLDNGRINVAGLNTKNMNYVIESIIATLNA